MKTSPNCDSRDGHIIDMLVLHYTGMPTAKEALERLCDPQCKVSAHYMIEEDGKIHALVPEGMRAWHAGKSFWRGHENINQRSIGIEIVNPGHEFGYRVFPEKQIESLTHLCKEILARHPIPARNVVAHSDIAPTRKEDPGELFPWERLAQEGIGVFPRVENRESRVERNALLDSSRSTLATLLASYGYSTTHLPKSITAFQRHFRQKSLTGEWDKECGALLAALLAMV